MGKTVSTRTYMDDTTATVLAPPARATHTAVQAAGAAWEGSQP